jgi:hypothetical protein
MKHLRRLFLSFTLMCVLAGATFGGETQSPPCAPGETNTPPCVVETVNDDSAPLGETSTSSALPVVDVTDITEALLWSLLLF